MSGVFRVVAATWYTFWLRIFDAQFSQWRISMMFASTDILGRHLRPLCSRENHVMKYESGSSSSNKAGNQAAYHCGFMGCSVRYNLVDGYYMLIGMPDHANAVDEPGVNTDRKSTRLNSSHGYISYA